MVRTNDRSSGACAACKHRRMKCRGVQCPMAPYFPANKSQELINVLKLFGFKNITKTLRTINPLKKQDYINSIIDEANARAFDPVCGCIPLISSLNEELNFFKAELDRVLQQLAMYKSHYPCPTNTHDVNMNYPAIVQNNQEFVGVDQENVGAADLGN
ncbi:hypothetical protein ACJIZ3_016021 [Penstemon smallii]|uniref:LOB domain-containing protein n=1 Tax=Penstemon smallii TaxID=265156 RepID=A0ABD3RPF8_9LAMI